ncbi:hypothetical protein AYM40_26645 [Paraburkholderia phytofirmans OLGA172]|uniref:HTH hxlR-type domain-containing protein n=1 Tax=Paraburkholderia phytofirmans OLGA172 TaxID=1417228 RepID=A0A161I2Y3_9BURK|nr:helix-turn-helix domain-containing protein [Paraburkholderia phytofirmans]ANB75883.1 hypothetical protein AYM40_26645 [Paraburkholderia phytofirmans OLGA172]
MKRKSFDKMQCPIARSLERVGEWWTILILRDAMNGLRKFDDFQSNLGISPTILSKRLSSLVEDGFLERHRYGEHPARAEYHLTDRGWAFQSVIASFVAFGNSQFAPEGLATVVVNRETGQSVNVKVVDERTGEPITSPKYYMAPGPVASKKMKAQLAAAPSNGRGMRGEGCGD